MDKFSKQIIISQIESLLTYADRFYNRQFITRDKINHQILERLEKVLIIMLILNFCPKKDYQQYNILLMSYIFHLSTLLRAVTGLNTQQHIHEKLLEKAKEKLSTTNLSVSEIAYQLGFEHPQSFNKLFKTKTNLSPLQFRAKFN